MVRTAFALFLVMVVAGCRQPAPRPAPEPPPPGVHTTDLDYVDTDAFDALFESVLINQDPVIVIHTGRSRPDWDGRLNAWIAAWNRGGPIGAAPPRTVRGQIPLPGVKLDEGTLREFRLLVGSLMDRVDGLARDGTAWWSQEQLRSQRIGLLKPYDLRFHIGGEGDIELVFFNGNYASYYPDFVKNLTGATAEADETGDSQEWMRTFHCSRCRAAREKDAREGILTGRAHAE
jgi:hypothetical protein